MLMWCVPEQTVEQAMKLMVVSDDMTCGSFVHRNDPIKSQFCMIVSLQSKLEETEFHKISMRVSQNLSMKLLNRYKYRDTVKLPV